MSPNTLLSSIRWALFALAMLALLTAAALAGRSWLAAHDAAVSLAAVVASQQKLLDQATARQEQREEMLAKTLARIEQAKKDVQTPAQAAANIPQALPPLPVPVSIEIPEPTPDEPSPPAMATVPQPDLKPIYDYLQDCRACQAQLSAVQGDLADERNKVEALITQRNFAVKAARGGGFWSRFKTAAKWLLVGGAIGALAVEGSRHF